MNNLVILLLIFCFLLFSSCSKQSVPFVNEARAKSVDARAGQSYAQYAVYNPAFTADAGIEAMDVEFAKGLFVLLNPSEENLRILSETEYVSIYYNRLGQVLVEIKGK